MSYNCLYGPLYKSYSYENKKEKINNKEYKVQYVKNHSKIKAICYSWIDNNADDIRDGWANRHDWCFNFFVLYKGDRHWTKMGDGWESYKDTNLGHLLFALENDEIKEKIIRKARIKELEEIIKSSKKELETLMGKKGKME